MSEATPKREIVHVGQQRSLVRGRVGQELDRQSPPLAIDHRAPASGPAGLCQQVARPQEVGPVAVDAARFRKRERLVEDTLRQLSAKRLEERQLLPAWQIPGGEFRAGEIAVRARVEAVVDGAIGPREVEGQRQGFAHADVGQLRAAGVEDEGRLEAGLDFGVVLSHDQPAVGLRRDVVARAPLIGVGLDPVVDQPLAQGFPRHGRVAVELVADGVEVVPTSVDGQIAAPVVGHPFPQQELPLLEIANPIGAAAERHVQGELAQVPRPPIMLRQDGHVGRRTRERVLVEPADRLEPKHDHELVQDLHRVDDRQRGAYPGVGLREDVVERELHVPGRDRRAVVPMSVRLELHRHLAQVVGKAHPFREVAVDAIGFVVGANEQAVVQHSRCNHADCRRPERQERREVRVVDLGGEHQGAAFRRIGIGVVEVFEVRPVLELVEGRYAVLPALLGCDWRGHGGQHQQHQDAQPFQEIRDGRTMPVLLDEWGPATYHSALETGDPPFAVRHRRAEETDFAPVLSTKEEYKDMI